MESKGAETYRGNIEKLLVKVFAERGLDLGQYRRPYVERRVAARLRSLGLHTYRQYSAYIDGHPGEYDRLLDTLTINVTDFFRDPGLYDVLRRTVFPQIIASKDARRHRMVRLWSAGCATGEEPYSVMMALLDLLGPRAEDLVVSMTATDIDPVALAIADLATYDVSDIGRIPRHDRMRYIDVADGTFTFRPAVTERVKFRRLNLFEDAPIGMVDLILCRNVFIYFGRQQQELILEKFWTALCRGGYLVLGRSEKLAPSLAGRLELVDSRERIFRKPIGRK